MMDLSVCPFAVSHVLPTSEVRRYPKCVLGEDQMSCSTPRASSQLAQDRDRSLRPALPSFQCPGVMNWWDESTPQSMTLAPWESMVPIQNGEIRQEMLRVNIGLILEFNFQCNT